MMSPVPANLDLLGKGLTKLYALSLIKAIPLGVFENLLETCP